MHRWDTLSESALGENFVGEDLVKLEEEQMPASCWASLASTNAAGEREPLLSNAKQLVGKIWVCRKKKELYITLSILESQPSASAWSSVSAHTSSEEGTPWQSPTAGQAAGDSVRTLNVSLPLLHIRCKIWVKKSTCFRECRPDQSTSRLRRHLKSHKCYRASSDCLRAQLLFKEEADAASSLSLHHGGCHTRGPFSSSGPL